MSVRFFRAVVTALGGVMLFVNAAPAAADPAPQAQTPAPAQAAQDSRPSPDYFFPDLPAAALVHDGRRWWIKPIIAVVADYTWFEQDDASLAQVGEQENSQDLRAARLGLIVRSKGTLHWTFTVTADYQERRTRDDATFQVYDVKLELPLGPVNVTVGKQKQPFAFEMVGLFPQLPQQERILSPFFVTRSIGVQLAGQLAGDRMTWAVGGFNDWLENHTSFRKNASDYVARLTGLASVSPDNRDYLHLGLGLRRVSSDDGMMRFSGRPESNVADKYVDTGDFPADHASQLSLEAVWQRGPFALHAEHIDAWVEAPERGDPHFSGSYVTASWVVTGESRPYVRALATAGGIVPDRRLGAVELVARYGHVNLTDASIDGGVLGRWGLGVNWWASRQWKLGISYGDADLDRDAVLGNTRMLLTRLQWLY